MGLILFGAGRRKVVHRRHFWCRTVDSAVLLEGLVDARENAGY